MDSFTPPVRRDADLLTRAGAEENSAQLCVAARVGWKVSTPDAGRWCPSSSARQRLGQQQILQAKSTQANFHCFQGEAGTHPLRPGFQGGHFLLSPGHEPISIYAGRGIEANKTKERPQHWDRRQESKCVQHPIFL